MPFGRFSRIVLLLVSTVSLVLTFGACRHHTPGQDCGVCAPGTACSPDGLCRHVCTVASDCLLTCEICSSGVCLPSDRCNDDSTGGDDQDDPCRRCVAGEVCVSANCFGACKQGAPGNDGCADGFRCVSNGSVDYCVEVGVNQPATQVKNGSVGARGESRSESFLLRGTMNSFSGGSRSGDFQLQPVAP